MWFEQNDHGERRSTGGDLLFLLERFIFYTGLVVLNTNHGLDPFLWGQKPSIGWGVGEEQPEKYRGDKGQDTGDGDQPFPGFETWGLDMCAAEGKQAQDDDGNTIHKD